MAKIAITLPCKAGGFTTITLCTSSQRTGGDNDKYALRIVRRAAGQGEAILPGTPRMVLTSSEDVRSWTWIDPSIPVDGVYTYVLQVLRIDGLGVFNEMVLTGQHFKK